jgi:hypothetical protein
MTGTYDFAKHIPNGLCERLRRDVHKSNQLLDTSFRSHNGLLNSGVPVTRKVNAERRVALCF